MLMGGGWRFRGGDRKWSRLSERTLGLKDAGKLRVCI